jgi:hypothetical protein
MMRRLIVASLLLALATAAPAAADWLVTRAGGRIETQGHWQVKGKLIVFTGTNGTLGSLRLADVDLAASETATAEAKQAKEKAATVAEEPAKPKERKKSVRSLTDADFSHKPADDGTAKDGAAKEKDKDGADGKPAAKDGSQSQVVVQTWSKEDRSEGDGINLYGTLQNNGKDLAADIVLRVILVNESKETVGTAEGVLAATSIPAGGSTSFRVPFAGVFAFAQARFEVANKTVTMAAPAAEDAAKKKVPPPPASGKP